MMKHIDIPQLLNEISRERPIFHAEKDFQHTLAWMIQRHWPTASIRLERRSAKIAQRMYIDIRVELGDHLHLVELKYKTRSLVIEHSGEPFELLNQGAHDIGRYDFLKDVQRLEVLISTYSNATGYAILLTNDSSYRKQTISNSTIDADFHLEDGRTISGVRRWQENAGKGTTKGREAPIALSEEYTLTWPDLARG